jgi:hypothetical protein
MDGHIHNSWLLIHGDIYLEIRNRDRRMIKMLKKGLVYVKIKIMDTKTKSLYGYGIML